MTKQKTIISGPMEHAGENFYFRNVHIFINGMKNMVIIKDDKLVRNNLYTCFKGKLFY